MKLLIRNYPALVIPDELLVPMQKPFNEHTPYVSKVAARWKSKSYLNRKLPLKILCLEAIKDRAVDLGSYDSYSDPMAGIGISARILGKNRTVRLNDLDEGCRKVLAANFKGKIGADDVLTAPLRSADMIFLDFNDFTYKRAVGKYAPVIEKSRDAARKFLVVNDCSPFYLRYGETSFKVYSRLMERNITSVKDYFRALVPRYKRLGFHLVQVNYFAETSFLLLSKEPAKLKLEDMSQKAIAPGFVSVEPAESLAA